jgi:hypothetical protein
MKLHEEFLDSNDALEILTHHKDRRSDASINTSDLNPDALIIQGIGTKKQSFQGMKMYDHMNPSQINQ